MTPNDIQYRKFDKSMNGYRVESVNAFLIEMADYVERLQKERDELEKKMDVLADKLEEYREDEESLRAALIGAQKLGDSVVRESKKKAEAIIIEAEQQAKLIVSDAQGNIDKESRALTDLQREVAKFKKNILSMYKEQMDLIEKIPYNDIPEPTPAPKRIEFVPEPDLAKDEPATEPEPDSTASGATSVISFDDFRPPNNSSTQENETVRKSPSKFGGLNEFFGEKNPVKREN